MVRDVRFPCAVILICGWAACASAAEYVVRSGDTLASIARSALGDETQWSRIAQLNGMSPPYAVRTGQRLKVPDLQPQDRPARVEDVPPALTAGSLHLPEPAWAWVAAAAAGLLVFGAICLRGGCWFSLVETTFGKCLLLSLLEALLLAACLAGVAATVYRSLSNGPPSPWTIAIVGGVLALGWLIGSILLTKRMLQCKWRSVVTVLVMAGLVQNMVLAAIGAVLLPVAGGIAMARGWLAALGW